MARKNKIERVLIPFVYDSDDTMINATELSNGNVIYELVRVDEKMDPISGYVYMVYTSDTPFTDVKSSTWYVEAVKYAYEAGIMGGVSETKFSPNGAVTRAQVATILQRFCEKH